MYSFPFNRSQSHSGPDTNGRAMPPALTREALLAFAFANADLLIETDIAGTVLFAAGPASRREAAIADKLVGTEISALLHERDRQIWPTLCARLLASGRLPSTVVRLADPAEPARTLAGVRLSGAPVRLCFTLGRLPVQPDRPTTLALDGLARAAEGATRGGGTATLGMIELSGWDRAVDAMGSECAADLAARLAEMIANDARASAAAGAGRFGVLANDGQELAAITARLETAIRAEGLEMSAASLLLHLEPMGLTPEQTIRTLRFALDRFADGGAERLAQSGLADDLDGFVREAAERARTLRRAIEDRNFRLVFQPVVNLKDGAVHHHEALLRTPPSNDRLLRDSQDFVLLAETLGLAEILDRAVLETAADTAIAAPGLRIAVNISGVSVQSASFRAYVCALLRDRPGLAPRLLIELTETAAVTELDSAGETMQLFRRNGVSVCLDDFGAGAAAFRYLREFPVDFVKIDGSYVGAAVARERDRSLLAGMVEIASAAGARIIAERIEHRAEAELMRSLGVALGQGYLFGRPAPLPLMSPRGIAMPPWGSDYPPYPMVRGSHRAMPGA